jgi:hypothetical protein
VTGAVFKKEKEMSGPKISPKLGAQTKDRRAVLLVVVVRLAAVADPNPCAATVNSQTKGGLYLFGRDSSGNIWFGSKIGPNASWTIFSRADGKDSSG